MRDLENSENRPSFTTTFFNSVRGGRGAPRTLSLRSGRSTRCPRLKYVRVDTHIDLFSRASAVRAQVRGFMLSLTNHSPLTDKRFVHPIVIILVGNTLAWFPDTRI